MQLEWPPGRTEVLIRVQCCCRAPLRAQRQLCLFSGRGFATGLEGAMNHTETWCVALPSVSCH